MPFLLWEEGHQIWQASLEKGMDQGSTTLQGENQLGSKFNTGPRPGSATS